MERRKTDGARWLEMLEADSASRVFSLSFTRGGNPDCFSEVKMALFQIYFQVYDLSIYLSI